jgi:hypothetical protein
MNGWMVGRLGHLDGKLVLKALRISRLVSAQQQGSRS